MRKTVRETAVGAGATAIAAVRAEQRALIVAAAELEACPSDAVIARIAELEIRVFGLLRYRDGALETELAGHGDIRFAGLLVGATDEAAALMTLSAQPEPAA